MLVENQMVETTWCSRTKEWYLKKGYKYTGMRTKLVVKAEDLHPGSSVFVKVKCDDCGEVFIQKMYYYLKQREKNSISLCIKCSCKRNGRIEAKNKLKERQHIFYNKALKVCKEKGYIPVSNENDYINQKSIFVYKCPKHGMKEALWSNFIRGNRCRECSFEDIGNQNRLNIEEVKKYFIQNNCELLNPDEYVSYHTTNLKTKCLNCGKIYTTSFLVFKNGKKLCKDCVTNVLSKEKMLSNDYLKEFIESKNNNKLLNVNEYRGFNTKKFKSFMWFL